jgi:hypothetical protein
MIFVSKPFSGMVHQSMLLGALLLLSLLLCLPQVSYGRGVRAAQSPTSGNLVQQPSQQASSSRKTGRTKIAEGEYVILEQANSGAIGPFGEEVYNFHETWTLWRVETGQYEIDGVRRFESPKDVPRADRFLVHLSRDLTVMNMTEFTKLRWRRDSGPLTCDFLPSELHCSSGARDPKQSIELRIPMEQPFGLLWPVSVFSLSGLTREAERGPNRGTPVELVTIEQPSAQEPVSPTVLNGTLQYLGQEDFEAGKQKWSALKFSLKVPFHPQFLIWTSLKGILLGLAMEHSHVNWPEEGMKLTRFQQWADF